jgi:hypothetical protein
MKLEFCQPELSERLSERAEDHTKNRFAMAR